MELSAFTPLLKYLPDVICIVVYSDGSLIVFLTDISNSDVISID